LKFSGSGDEVLKRFYKVYKKAQERAKKLPEETNTSLNTRRYYNSRIRKKISPQQIEANKLSQKLTNQLSSLLSPWEKRVCKRLLNSKIGFVVKFRKFPLDLGNGILAQYTPDFVLKDHEYNGKRLLIEVQELLTEKDAIVFGAFMETYGGQYHLIMVVSDGQLRMWNELDQNRKKLFNDIWTIEDLDFFIKDLKKYESTSSTREDEGEEKDRRNRNQIISHMIKPTKTLYCIGCRLSFDTADFSQLYCFKCLKYLE